MAEEDLNIKIWRLKKLLEKIDSVSGNGTSVISLIIPPTETVAGITGLLSQEYGTASNIKSRLNRLAVQSAITSAQNRLKLYHRIPENGLVVYSGSVIENGKPTKMSIHFTPFRPINTFIYLCDNKFHTQPIRELLQHDDTFGFIIMDGYGTLWGTLSGSSRRVLQKYSVELPKKHRRGGQSSVRFSRLREEARRNYVRKVGELSRAHFINETTNKANVTGLVLAGSADFKNVLATSELFDPRLRAIVLKTVDINYGGESGFNQAVDLAGDVLRDVKFIREQKQVGKFLFEIARDTKRYCFGIEDTLRCLDMGAVEDLIIWEDLPHIRVVLRGPEGDLRTHFWTQEQVETPENYVDKDTRSKLETVEKELFTEWMSVNYTRFGSNLHFVTDKSQEGSQFVQGFGGVGGVLRWAVDLAELAMFEEGEMSDSAMDDLEDFI
eukprot:gnl/Dysnectes_brevis/239_a270_2921.p1 GENE.gnl/Dysnectes_brevis/239_a270_2921~~gnl/Dysnectes_brevis/239_a270_2921.p1  ORF type:complete len:439 (+),score=192.83 gnl/Dysnectes_brevis/239_a270_2921:933-2249(+)